ncbi:MAG: AtpZ/AtpI family protein [Acidimicrobiia bacterium]|nr:AtpZ/AtpI family protein [Acidimicrobiia bacterium]
MSNVGQDFINGGDFFGAIMAGFLLGLGADYLFGTQPVLVVSGIIAGSITGFFVMYRHLKDANG